MGIPVIRRQAVEHLEKYTTGPLGPEAIQEILLDGGWEEGLNPSPEMCHWLLWKLGCRDSRILSRNVPENRIVRVKEPVAKLCSGAQRLAAWKSFRLENEPEPGDIVLSGIRQRGDTETARVFVSIDRPKTWRLVEAWVDARGAVRISEVVAEVRGENLVVGDRKATLMGWVDIVRALGDGDAVSQ